MVGGVGKVALKVKVPAAEPDDLSSIPETHTVDGDNQFLMVGCPLAST